MYTPNVVLDQLFRNSHFYLTGSRFFGTANTNSDFDFFTQDTASMRTYLESFGFEILEKSYSESDVNDNNIAAVYRLQSWENFSGSQIDVQLVKDVDLKCLVQEIFARSRITPTSASWKAAYAVLAAK